MKKLISALLAGVLLLGLCACGSSEAATPTQAGQQGQAAVDYGDALLVGYSRKDITPTVSVPLAGSGNTSQRMSNGYQTYLYTTCIAYRQGDTTILVYQNDLINANPVVVENVRAEVEENLGIPGDNVMISGTHTHSAPDMGSSEPSIGQYRPILVKTMVQAAEEALEDLKPVTAMYHGTRVCENLNFVRHYTTEAGVVKGDNFNDWVDSPYTGHTHDADNLMQVARIDREGGESIVLVNWQSHPHRGGGGTNLNITADIVGVMRDYVEQNAENTRFIYFTGASGNVNPSSRITEENITKDYWEQGDALGEHAVAVLEGEMTELTGRSLQITKNVYVGEVNHSEDHLLNVANIVNRAWKETNDKSVVLPMCEQYGLNSPYHAGAIISRAGLDDTYDVPMWAYNVGDLAFVTAPYEMFDTQGVTIREGSPFAATFVVTCCNDSIGYIPSMEGFNNNSYEANNGKFVPGTGEILAEEYIKMLEGLYDTK